MNRSLWADFAHHFRLGLRTYFAPLRWLPVWLAILAATLATGCAATKPADLADYEAVARVTSFVGCREISQSLKRDERDAVGASLTIVLAGLSSGRLDGLDAALEEIGLRDQGHRLLVTAALHLAVSRLPENIREHYAAAVARVSVLGCRDGMAAGAPQP